MFSQLGIAKIKTEASPALHGQYEGCMYSPGGHLLDEEDSTSKKLHGGPFLVKIGGAGREDNLCAEFYLWHYMQKYPRVFLNK